MKHQDRGRLPRIPVELGSVVKLVPPPSPEENLFTVVSRPRLVADLNHEVLVVDLMTSTGQIIEGVPYEYLSTAS